MKELMKSNPVGEPQSWVVYSISVDEVERQIQKNQQNKEPLIGHKEAWNPLKKIEICSLTWLSKQYKQLLLLNFNHKLVDGEKFENVFVLS